MDARYLASVSLLALAGCGGAERQFELELVVAGLRDPSHTVTATVRRDGAEEPITFAGVDNGSHEVEVPRAGTYRLICPCPDPPPPLTIGERCRYSIGDTDEQVVELTAEDRFNWFKCDYSANGYMRFVATGADGLAVQATVVNESSGKSYTYSFTGGEERGDMALETGTHRVTCGPLSGKTVQPSFEVPIYPAGRVTVSCNYH